MSSQSNQETNDQDFIEITSPDGRLRSVYDKEADVAYVQLREHRYDHGELVDGNNKILEFDPEGQVHAIQFLNCSDGVNMREVPEELQEEATRTLERLGITAGHHGQSRTHRGCSQTGPARRDFHDAMNAAVRADLIAGAAPVIRGIGSEPGDPASMLPHGSTRRPETGPEPGKRATNLKCQEGRQNALGRSIRNCAPQTSGKCPQTARRGLRTASEGEKGPQGHPG